MRLFRADEIVLSLGNEVSQWQEEVSIGPGCPARRNRIFGSGEIRDPENNVVFLDDMQPGDFFFLIKKKKTSIAQPGMATAGVTRCAAVWHAAWGGQDTDVAGLRMPSRGRRAPRAPGHGGRPAARGQASWAHVSPDPPHARDTGPAAPGPTLPAPSSAEATLQVVLISC